jgi:lipid-A-disaccharide synthase
LKYFIIAGEKSGDMHAANLVLALKEKQPGMIFYGWGGESMKSAGVNIIKNYADLAFMGFWEVLKNLGKIVGFLNLAKEHIETVKPDAIILVDYAGFNLKIAKWAKNKGYKVIYYIAPKAWAWRESRAVTIRKYIDLLLLIFPFEKAFFDRYQVNSVYVGNPLFDEIQNFTPDPDFKSKHQIDKKPVVALLPGSRIQEIENMMSLMTKLAEQFPQYHWVVAGVKSVPKEIYGYAGNKFKIICNETYNILSVAKMAIVTSGTATLETALFKVPQVVVYKTSGLSFEIAKRLVKIPYISLVNLVAEKEVVRELIQGDYNEEKLKVELKKLISNTIFVENQLSDYDKIVEKLGGKGASETAASEIEKFFNTQS